MTWLWVVLLAIVLIGVLLYLSTTAGRLDRMHHRVEISRANLLAALERRRDLADHVAGVGVLDPASSLVVADAVERADRVAATAGDPTDGAALVPLSLAESDVSKVLCAVFEDRGEVTEMATGPGGDIVVRLADACRRVEIGRRFYNDAAIATRAMRGWRPVRYFRLAGTAKMPETVEMVDTVPAGFAGY